MPHRGPFQPLPFCDSVIYNEATRDTFEIHYTHTHRLMFYRCMVAPSKADNFYLVA